MNTGYTIQYMHDNKSKFGSLDTYDKAYLHDGDSIDFAGSGHQILLLLS